ncbi:hypothetical protein EV356DRAFT_507360 [Viridothelium virens]|uniref:Uncharacterized protein n=1 Tax=Viridothelium virens TaxID=1048519 RepID=A0A6A6HJE5_VIRVR|nr:hypothetical protein EV356DRAFT_507360 [Viridothelium virens]
MSKAVPSNPAKTSPSQPKNGQSTDLDIPDTSSTSLQNAGPVLRGPAPRSKERREKTSQQKAPKYSGSNQASDVFPHDRDNDKMAGKGSTVPFGDRGVTRLPRRTRASQGKSSQAPVQDHHTNLSERPLPQPQGASWLLQIAKDTWHVIRFALTLPRLTYPVWKWVLFIYLLALCISWLFALLRHYTVATLSPICSIPIIGSRIPFCTWSLEFHDGSNDASKVATSQEELTIVMDRAGQNFEFARDMVGHEFTLRDLRIRVAASDLARGKEIAQELASLAQLTKRTAKNLSRFTARVGKSIDAVSTFDNYAVKRLEDIAEERRTPSTISTRAMAYINPFAVLDFANPNHSEEQVKRIFISTAAKISDKVKTLLDDSFELNHDFDEIQETLDRIRELVSDEIGDLPRMNVLAALWARLARPDDYEKHKSHTSLLTHLANFYESSSEVMQETTVALNRVEAELTEFRDDFATPGLTLQDYPLEVSIELLRKSGQRLESGRTRLEDIEEGKRPLRVDSQMASTRTLTATRH